MPEEASDEVKAEARLRLEKFGTVRAPQGGVIEPVRGERKICR